MGEIFDRFEVEPQKGADITIGTRFPEIFVSDRDEIICYLGICLNEDNEESDLIFLYLDQDLIKQEIADIFQVTKSQVKSKLSKYGINKQRKWMRDSLNYGIKQAGKETLAELVFGFHDIANATANDKLISGPVKVINGKHKGRIGIYADHQDNFGLRNALAEL